MTGLAQGIEAAAIGYGLQIILLLLIMTLVVALGYIMHSKQGRLGRLKFAGRKTIISVVVVALFFVAVNYQLAVRARASAVTFHTERSTEDGGLYTARYAYLANGMILLRVYRTANMTLRAERTYRYDDAARLVWTKPRLIYDTASGSGGSVALPPPLYDRIMAHLP